MNIIKTRNDDTLEVKLEGRLDSPSSAELSASLEEEEDYADIRFDCEKLEYISSAGLRVFFACRKKLGEKQHVVLAKVNALVREILRISGFDKQVTLE